MDKFFKYMGKRGLKNGLIVFLGALLFVNIKIKTKCVCNCGDNIELGAACKQTQGTATSKLSIAGREVWELINEELSIAEEAR